MRRPAALLASVIVATGALAGCGGDSEYCAAVKKDRATLETFGDKRTDAAFATYRRATREVSAVAPAAIGKDWTALSTAVARVLKAQKDVDLKLEDVTAESVAQLTPEQGQTLNDAYQTFTRAVAKHGKAVDADVQSACDIKL